MILHNLSCRLLHNVGTSSNSGRKHISDESSGSEAESSDSQDQEQVEEANVDEKSVQKFQVSASHTCSLCGRRYMTKK